MPVTHEEAIRYLSDEYDTFAGGSDFRVLHLSGILDYFLGMSIWHTLMHRSALCYVPSELQAQFSVTSLIRLTGCTHLAVPLDVSAVVHEEVEKMAANSALAQKKSSLQTLIVPCLSSANWGISSLSHSKIRLMVGDDPSRVKPSPPKPAEISVLQRKPDTDLTPLRVLELIPLGTVIHDLGTRVVQITDDLVVKYGPSVRYVEALNTLHVLERTDIPVPDVYLVFKQGDATYIVMQFIRGRTVQSCWHMLDDSQHQHVASELARYLCELHASSVSTPSKRPGPLDGGKCEGIWFTLYGAGPFATYEDLVCWLNWKLALSGAPTNRQFTTDHPLVFTHQDMSLRNLILDDVNKLWVLDWDMAGWYPAYFDYTCIASDIGTPAVPIPLGWSKTILSHLPDYQENYRSQS
ncbi:kinase-like protein [Sparassis crispa]|uniref:Kinase-like protein n=1 Tax=Sparassis crispa TaxID=139825 RepID=A0A401G9D7_9APHY|nr:kinase-like protein [Sparassis crispa]GBE78759.1 kinase-like protein [Sparassis crispa]